MGLTPDISAYSLCSFFLTGYLSNRDDPVNFEPGALARYEKMFEDALRALSLSKESLKAKPEFNFDSSDGKALESGIAVLRVAIALQRKNFRNITLLTSKSTTGADLVCDKNGSKICFEVKSITKESTGRPGYYLEEQLYEKIREHASKARAQLKATAAELKCDLSIYVVVSNWVLHTMVVSDESLHDIVENLDREPSLGEVDGAPIGLGEIDGVLIIDSAGISRWFLEKRAKVIDC